MINDGVIAFMETDGSITYGDHFMMFTNHSNKMLEINYISIKKYKKKKRDCSSTRMETIVCFATYVGKLHLSGSQH